MLTKPEVRVLYHILDCIAPDLERNQFGRYELKPEDCREYVNDISLSESEYLVFKQIKEKMQASLSGFTLRNGRN